MVRDNMEWPGPGGSNTRPGLNFVILWRFEYNIVARTPLLHTVCHCTSVRRFPDNDYSHQDQEASFAMACCSHHPSTGSRDIY